MTLLYQNEGFWKNKKEILKNETNFFFLRIYNKGRYNLIY